ASRHPELALVDASQPGKHAQRTGRASCVGAATAVTECRIRALVNGAGLTAAPATSGITERRARTDPERRRQTGLKWRTLQVAHAGFAGGNDPRRFAGEKIGIAAGWGEPIVVFARSATRATTRGEGALRQAHAERPRQIHSAALIWATIRIH